MSIRGQEIDRLWFKSSRSADGACVEVARDPGSVGVRDSKRPSGSVLDFPVDAWHAFVAGIRDGRFDPT